ncbi:phospholipid transfer protein [Neoarius graeffei]|uniref:phospholipid transfer protein n=1 Tax=Neoarius graeffei TaxID=443677 RepID=UPI00298D5F06|nr:phospholipid transfer protein [Neoarius graeffei]XP_060775334.1 phospholipid transfer protein [Neoarius graeffei]XP_060775335.1 phospholipid transfer protein [Neoarius graeffei]
MGLWGMAVILFLLPHMAQMTEISPGFKIRITSRGLELLKHETQKFVEQELGGITMPEMHGKNGNLQYSITNINITELNLTADLSFQPVDGLLFDVHNSSITLNFQRRVIYWLLQDEGAINASADGVYINTTLHLAKDYEGRLKIANVSCDASIAKMKAKFGGTFGRVYDFVAIFMTTGMRFVLSRQICPALNHAGLVLINQLLETIPVRTKVDRYVGIDYSLLSDPVVTGSSLDMEFRGMFYDLQNENDILENYSVSPVLNEYNRMIYMVLSEYFFDSGLYSYFKGGVFKMHIVNERMPKDLEMLLRTTYFGAIMLLNPALMDAPISLEMEVTSAPKSSIMTSGATVVVHAGVRVLILPSGKSPVQLSSMTMETKFIAKVYIKEKRLAIQLDLRRFKIFSNQSALESLALIPLQAPLKAMLQVTIVPLLNNYTKKGVQIPLPDGIEVIEDVVKYHDGYITVAADLHFRSGLKELIEKTTS